MTKKICALIILLAASIIAAISCGTNAGNDITADNEESYSTEPDEVPMPEYFNLFNTRIENTGGVWYLYTDYDFPDAEPTPRTPDRGYGAVMTFGNMKEFKEKLTNASFREDELGLMRTFFARDENGIIVCDPAALREITNLPEEGEYRQHMIEWTGGNDYAIGYQSKNQTGLGVHILNEAGARKYMTDALAGTGNYEELQKNNNISNIRRTIEKTEMGDTEACIFDSETVKDQKNTYAEFTYNGVEYAVSEHYLPDGTLQYAWIFAFDGDNSFGIIDLGNNLTFKDIVSLKSSYVTEDPSETNKEVTPDKYNTRIENTDGVWYLCTDMEPYPPPDADWGRALTLTGTKELKEKLTYAAFTANDFNNMKYFPRGGDGAGIIVCDPAALREITNLPVEGEYRQTYVAWTGGDNYRTEYQGKDSYHLSVTITDEEKLREHMAERLAGWGTYEELQNNDGISNLTLTIEKTEAGDKEVLCYDIEPEKNTVYTIKRTYTEFTYNGAEYAVSEKYTSGGMFESCNIFVFNGGDSFMIYSGGAAFTYGEITSLKLSYVK